MTCHADKHPNCDISPIRLAVSKGHADTVKFLLSQGANVDGNDTYNGYTLLHDAPNREIADLLFKAGAKIKNSIGDSSPLEDVDSVEMAEFFIEKGADVNSKDSMGRTPLYSAARKGNLKLVKYLVSKGAKVNVSSESIFGSKLSPLNTAIYNGHKDVARFLLKHSAKFDPSLNADGNLIHDMSEKGKTEIVELLLDSGFKIESRDKYYYRTPIFFAVKYGRNSVVKLLLDRGAKVNVKDDWDITPLHLAAWAGDIEIFKSLVKKGADVRAVTRGDEKSPSLCCWFCQQKNR